MNRTRPRANPNIARWATISGVAVLVVVNMSSTLVQRGIIVPATVPETTRCRAGAGHCAISDTARRWFDMGFVRIGAIWGHWVQSGSMSAITAPVWQWIVGCHIEVATAAVSKRHSAWRIVSAATTVNGGGVASVDVLLFLGHPHWGWQSFGVALGGGRAVD